MTSHCTSSPPVRKWLLYKAELLFGGSDARTRGPIGWSERTDIKRWQKVATFSVLDVPKKGMVPGQSPRTYDQSLIQLVHGPWCPLSAALDLPCPSWAGRGQHFFGPVRVSCQGRKYWRSNTLRTRAVCPDTQKPTCLAKPMQKHSIQAF